MNFEEILLELSYRTLLKSEEYKDSSLLWTEGKVMLKNTLFTVDIQNRTMLPTYWDSTPVEVRRATWFTKDDSVHKWSPTAEYVSDLLEKTPKFILKIENDSVYVNKVYGRQIEEFLKHDYSLYRKINGFEIYLLNKSLYFQ